MTFFETPVGTEETPVSVNTAGHEKQQVDVPFPAQDVECPSDAGDHLVVVARSAG